MKDRTAWARYRSSLQQHEAAARAIRTPQVEADLQWLRGQAETLIGGIGEE